MFITGTDIESNRLHRVVKDSQVTMRQAQHLDRVGLGEQGQKGSVVRGGYGSSGKSPFGKLNQND